MKKLLSLLSVLTISGTAVPTTIAASPYQKNQQETKLENTEINYQKIDTEQNLSYLNNNNFSGWDIFSALWRIGIKKAEEAKDYLVEKVKNIKNVLENLTINDLIKLFENKKQFTDLLIEYSAFKNDESFKTPRLYINWNANDYFDKLKKQILKSLLDNGIILNLNNTGGTSYFAINNNKQFNSFVIPISVERDNQSINIDLVFRLSDFYLQGFSYDTTYYHFSDSTITSINSQNPRNLNFDSNYNTLIGDSDPLISWSGIEQAFNDLINYGENPGNNSVIRGALARVILATAESMRFRQVRENIERTYNQNIQLSWRSDFYPIITNWSRTTNEAINYLTEHENSLNGFTHNSNILIFTALILSYLNKCENILKNNDETCYDVKMRPLEIYWNNENTDVKLHFSPDNTITSKVIIYELDLGKISPIDSFNKIKFLGNTKDSCWGTRVEWGSWVYNNEWGCDTKKVKGTDISSYLENISNKFHNSIKTEKIDMTLPLNTIKSRYTPWVLQNFEDYDFLAWVFAEQRFGLTCYFKNEHWYLQNIFIQSANWKSSYAPLDTYMKIGNGVRLYNE